MPTPPTPRGLLVSDVVAESHGPALRAAAPEHLPVVLRPDGVEGDLARVEVAFFSGDLYPDRVVPFVKAAGRVDDLRWLHSFSAGVDSPYFRQLLERGVRVTHSSGANARAVAQLAVLFLLGLARQLPARFAAQRERRWERRRVDDLEGATLVVLGLGPIGLEIARVAAALGMRVIGLRRRPRGDEPCETWPLERLDEALSRAEHLVLALPLTPETRHLIDAAALARLPRGARLVNVGRGELVDEAALVAALREGRLGGAGLDVFEVEPLPEASPLWELPNVILTPHDGGFTPGSRRRAEQLFLENLARWRRGETLVNEMPPAAPPPAPAARG